MLKELFIKNIILITSAKIEFYKGLNVISGETGSGKSAILEALNLSMGAKTDTSLIRHGEEKAEVTALFDLKNLSKTKETLDELGLLFDDPDILTIKREISLTGKSRSWINERPVQQATLKKVSETLLEMVSQHANHRLFQTDYHLELLDLFAESHSLLNPFQIAFKTYLDLKKQEEALQKRIPLALREIEVCLREIEEIEKANLKEGEEDLLFEEYSLLNTLEERTTLAKQLETLLSGEKGVLNLLTKGKGAAALLIQKDSTIKNDLSSFNQICIEIEELSYALRKYIGKLDIDPSRIQFLESRLSQINLLKKKYGKTIEEISSYLTTRKQDLKELETLEDQLILKKEERELLEKNVHEFASNLSSLREEKSNLLGKLVTKELKELHMEEAVFQVDLKKESLNILGQESAEFFLFSNKGERKIPIKDGASGGEIARVLLALQTILAEKKGLGTLIFDEIDANIGGRAALTIGEKLKKIGETGQVLCITHFPQVARQADHHHQISKQVENGRTESFIVKLDKLTRDVELARMEGRA